MKYIFGTIGSARFWRNQSGATAIEYAMIAAGVGAAIAAIVFTLGDTVLNNLFETIATAMGA
ncbi:MAG: Flp family type IVb pilin [Alphaproteobacteria bacterium]